jgi:hypothetical protein
MGQLKDNELLQKTAVVLKQLRQQHGLTQNDVYYDTKVHIGRIESFKINISLCTLS